MKKKLIVLLLTAVLVLSFAACSEDPDNETTAAENTSSVSESIAESTDDAVTEDAAEVTEEISEEASSEETEGETQLSEEESTSVQASEDEPSAEETTAEGNTAAILVEEVEDISGISGGKVFNASSDEYAFYAVFTVDMKVTDVNVLSLTYKDSTEDGRIIFDEEVLYTLPELTPDGALCVHLTAEGAIPAYGISYTDADGTEKRFSVNMSGEDGSLFLAAI